MASLTTTVNDLGRSHATAKNSSSQEKESTFSYPALVVALGLTLVVMSFLPLGTLAAGHLWTAEDASRYDRITLEYHKSAYQTPARQGLTDSQLQARQERLRKEFESLRDKLASARRQPDTWSRILRWTGSLLTLGSVAGYLASRYAP